MALAACARRRAAPDVPPAPPRPPAALVAEGRALFVRYECARCHDADGVPAPTGMRDCVGCHRAVRRGAFPASPEHLAEWRANLVDLVDAPTLTAVGRRLRADWIAAFLLRPVDLRPHLRATMPRLAITEREARAVAAFLTRDVDDAREAPPAASRVAEGRALYAAHRCARCHAFSDAASPAGEAAPDGDDNRLAPSLDHARARFRPEALARWIRDPASVKPGTTMPSHGLSREASQALAAYVLHAPLRAPARTTAPPMLPPLARRVTWEEVEREVFRRTCRHCHADASFAFGDGGPGNTGGFGFAPRGLVLDSYAGAQSGVRVGDARRSVFERDATGTPRLVRALRARQLEEAGELDPEVRGMPLGHPAVTPEALQLVTTWIALGRPRE